MNELTPTMGAIHSSAEASDASKASPKAGDLVAGSGSGGVFIYIAQHFITDPTASQIAIYLCPALSIFFIALYQKFSKFILDIVGLRIGEMERKRLITASDAHIVELRKKVLEIEGDRRSTSQHRSKIRMELEAAEIAHIKLLVKGSLRIHSDN